MPYKVFNSDEAAAYLHVPREVLDRLVKNKDVPFQVQGGRVVFTRYDIDAWASQRILRLSGENLDRYHKAATQAREEAGTIVMPDLVQARWVEPSLKSKTASAVLRDMVQVAERSEKLCDARQLLVLLEEREALCSTAVPGGLALLHPRQHTPFMFMESFIAAGRTVSGGIPFGSPDGALTDIFFLICCGDDRAHLHTLARLCTMCQKTEMLEAIRGAETAEAIVAAIMKAERDVVKRT